MYPKYIDFINKHQLNLELYLSGYALDDMQEGDIEKFRQQLNYKPEFTVHAPFMDLSPGAVDDKIREVTLNRYQQAMIIAGQIGAKSMVCHSGYDKWRYDHDVSKWFDASMKTWPEVIRMAGEHGVKIAIENIFEDNPDNLTLLMKELYSDDFGICFDAGHFNLFTTRTLPQWLDAIGEYIIELHLHDNKGDEDSHMGLGTGIFDFKALFEHVKGQDIIYTLEAHSTEGVEISLDWLKENL